MTPLSGRVGDKRSNAGEPGESKDDSDKGTNVTELIQALKYAVSTSSTFLKTSYSLTMDKASHPSSKRWAIVRRLRDIRCRSSLRAAGNRQEVIRLLHTFEAFVKEGGLLPEQIWDAPDIPEKELFLGKPSGSAMPLVWAHAGYVKLLRSLQDGHIFDMPPQTVKRYLDSKIDSAYVPWRFNHKLSWRLAK